MASTTVVDLTVYPVKSCAGIAVAKAALTETGLRFDRSWMVVEAREARAERPGRRKRRGKPKPSMFVSQRLDPCLARVEPSLPREVLDPGTWDGFAPPPEGACLVLRHAPAPGAADAIDRGTTNESHLGVLRVPLDSRKPLRRRLVQVWDWVGEAGDEGDEAAAWFSKIVGRPVRLVAVGAGGQPLSVPPPPGARVPLLAALAIASARATAGARARGGLPSKKRLHGITGRSAPTSLATSSISIALVALVRLATKTVRESRDRYAARRRGSAGRRDGRDARHGRGGVVGHGGSTRGRAAGDWRRRAADPRYAEEARACFSDGFPILLANQTSLDALNALLKAKNVAPVSMNRFRPNVVVGEAIGGGRVDAWAEDAWGRVTLTGKDAPRGAPGVGLDLVKPCSRCVMVTVSQESPPSKPRGPTQEPLATLSEERSGSKCGFDDEDWKETPFFAWNAVSDPARLGETVAVGDRVDVVRQRTFKKRA